ncbi:MAG: hypothetical protein COW88_01675 [Candidatus Lloydbacteria bacterium CG22_combo_CG10-13_8_21_14_all_47_15]|uniref:methionyl-tRNA formyltransferase n=1 Tax=Candidatus Lloydbacteria bacterium CG22_combo_CG10-13_8_21_14_all_47_15 TaxID=1974635 RepID=A0A2H0CVW3_9BACT|nr:MAG: hypothetical protein COW88_01675 [Candidatus Lloydbacteria bacterium CG22_combo_CG10-13_8_21_14_all_47_15]
MALLKYATQKNSMPDIVFFGTSQFAVGVLDALAQQDIIPKLIITTPTQPSGRQLKQTPPPVYEWAKEHNITVYQPEHMSDPVFLHCLDGHTRNDYSFQELSKTAWDIFIVSDYGKIIPKELLTIPKHGIVNIHPSLLPKFRGANPIRAAILEETETGVTIIQMDEKIDHGDILTRKKLDIPSIIIPYEILEEKLAALSGKLLADILPTILSKDIESIPQEHNSATYTKKTEKDDGFINLSDDPEKNYRKYCAYHSWPRTYFYTYKGDAQIRVIISDAALENYQFIIKKVIPDGRREMDWDSFVNGYGEPK